MVDEPQEPAPSQPGAHPRPHTFRFGRAAFLGLAGITTAGLAIGKVRVPSQLNLLSGGSNVNGFVIYTVNGVPHFDPATYRLEVTGLVHEPKTYTYKDLLAMQAVHETKYYQCVTGWSVPDCRWTGVRLWDLIQASGPKSGAKALSFQCMDKEYSESLTFAQAQKRDVLLAYSLNGKALSREQGLPLRLVVPGMYGYKFAKWVNRIDVVDRVMPGYWERNGYDVDAYIGRSNGQVG